MVFKLSGVRQSNVIPDLPDLTWRVSGQRTPDWQPHCSMPRAAAKDDLDYMTFLLTNVTDKQSPARLFVIVLISQGMTSDQLTAQGPCQCIDSYTESRGEHLLTLETAHLTHLIARSYCL